MLAVSQFTKSEIARTFDVPDGRIEVVYNAIDERFLHGHASQSDRDLIAERYQVNYPFLLYAGAIRPHKNVVRTIEAFSALKTELEKEQQLPDLKLIIIRLASDGRVRGLDKGVFECVVQRFAKDIRRQGLQRFRKPGEVNIEVRQQAIGLVDDSLAGKVSTNRLAIAAGLAATEIDS